MKINIKLVIIISIIIIIIFSFGLMLMGNKDSERGEGKLESHEESFMDEFNNAKEWVTYTYSISSGETIHIQLPKGVEKPDLETAESLYVKKHIQ